MLGHNPVADQPIASAPEFTASAPPAGADFFGSLHRIERGMVTITAAGLGGVLVE
jgi:hypothetical protein